jgi:hypothetical protein
MEMLVVRPQVLGINKYIKLIGLNSTKTKREKKGEGRGFG